MIKLKKRLVFALFLIALILISGCKGKKSTEKSLEEIRTGTEGIVLNFLANSPPDKIHADEADEKSNIFEVVLNVRNKGAFPQPDEGTSVAGRIFLSGYDTSILEFERFGKNPPTEELGGKALEGKSTINPNGGLDLVEFKGKVLAGYLNVEKYEPTLLATACYQYRTVAGPSICIDPNPYSTTKEKKVCEVNDVTLSSQGAPVAITMIDEEAFATKTQFKITVKNIGGGDVIYDGALNKCAPTGEKLTREDTDKVYLIEAKVSNKPLKCGPFVTNQGGIVRGESGLIRLINGEGFVICELQSGEYSDAKSAYTTPLTIKLLYAYRTTTEKKIQIKKEVSSTTGSSGTSPIVIEDRDVGGFGTP